MKKPRTMLGQDCPNSNCGAIWGMEEMDWQQCDACGYPNNEEYDDLDDDADLDLFDED